MRLCDAAGRVSARTTAEWRAKKNPKLLRSYILPCRLQWSRGCSVCCTVRPTVQAVCVFVRVAEHMTVNA